MRERQREKETEWMGSLMEAKREAIGGSSCSRACGAHVKRRKISWRERTARIRGVYPGA